MSTPHLKLVELQNGQANFLNANHTFAWVDALMFCLVINMTRTTPPSSPNDGDRYVMAAAWPGVADAAVGAIALYRAGDGWSARMPEEGWMIENKADSPVKKYRYSGTAWVEWSGGGGGGMTNPMTAAGDLIVGGALGDPQRLGIGTNGKVLKVVSGALTWADDASGADDAYSTQSGSAVTLNYGTARTWGVNLTADCTITLTGATSGKACGMTVILTQDATGGRSVTWPAGITWRAGTAPTIGTLPGQITVVTLMSVDGGTSWLGTP